MRHPQQARQFNMGPAAKRGPSPGGGRGGKKSAVLKAFKGGLAVLLALALLSILYVVWWFFMASQLRGLTVDWAERKRAQGYTIQLDQLQLGGFPFDLRMTTGNPVLGAPGDEIPWIWSAKTVIAEMRPWKPGEVKITASGDQRLNLTVDGRDIAYQGQAKTATAILSFTSDGVFEGQVRIRELSLVSGDEAWDMSVTSLSVRARNLNDANPQEPTVTVDVRAEDITVPAALSLPLGNHIARLVLQIDLLGSLPDGIERNSLALWRDQGGTVEVRKLDIRHGPLSLKSNGTLALDAGLQPVGAFTAKVQGFFETVEVLRQKGIIRSRDAVTAKYVLGALSRPAADGGPPVLNLSVSIQKRKVRVGPVTVAKLPVIRWPEK